MSDDISLNYLPTSWYDPRVEVRPSSIQGGGMFARAPFRPGETVTIVGRTLMTGAEFAAYLEGVERWNAHQIGAGEELTLDYALTTTAPGWTLDQPCRCGAPGCHGSMTGNDWRLPDVQARYAGHFVPYSAEASKPLRSSGG